MKKFMFVVLGVILFVIPLCACSGTGIGEVVQPTPTEDPWLIEEGFFFDESPRGMAYAGMIKFRTTAGIPDSISFDFIFDFDHPIDVSDWAYAQFYARDGYQWEIKEENGKNFAVLTQE